MKAVLIRGGARMAAAVLQNERGGATALARAPAGSADRCRRGRARDRRDHLRIVLGIDETAYTILTLVLVIGGVMGGYEHDSADEGAVRGLCSGVVFGTLIVATSAVSGMHPEAKLPDPPGFLPVITGIITLFLGGLGGRLRGRHEKRQRVATREAQRA